MGQNLAGASFENSVAQLYRQLGSLVRQNVILAGFQIDMYVEEETPSKQKLRSVVECKCHHGKVGNKTVNDFSSIVKTLKDSKLADRGIIVSSSGFSKEAFLVSRETGIELLHFDDLRQIAGLVESGQEELFDLSMLTAEERALAKRYFLKEYFQRDRRYLLFVVEIKKVANRSLKKNEIDRVGGRFIKITQLYLEEYLKDNDELFEYVNGIHLETIRGKDISPEDWQRLCSIGSRILVQWGWMYETR